MIVSRRQFITSLVVAPAIPQVIPLFDWKTAGLDFYSYDIETVPIPRIFYMDSVTECWEILKSQGKVK